MNLQIKIKAAISQLRTTAPCICIPASKQTKGKLAPFKSHEKKHEALENACSTIYLKWHKAKCNHYFLPKWIITVGFAWWMWKLYWRYICMACSCWIWMHTTSNLVFTHVAVRAPLQIKALPAGSDWRETCQPTYVLVLLYTFGIRCSLGSSYGVNRLILKRKKWGELKPCMAKNDKS